MQLSPELLKTLQALLREQTGREYDDLEAMRSGVAIMRLVMAKQKLTQKEASD